MKVFKKLLQSRSLFGSLAILVLWYILHLAIGSNIIPGPFETIVTFLHLMTGPLLLHILSSILRITVAIALSMGIGIPLGLWMGLSKRADSFISPIAYILYPIPKVAFLPLFMVPSAWSTSKIILILSIIVFQIILAVRDGVKEILRSIFIGGNLRA